MLERRSVSRESTYSVFRLITASLAIGDSHTGVTISNVGDGSVEAQPFIVFCQERACLAFEPGIESTLIPDKVVFVRPLVECCILPEDETTTSDEAG